MSRSTMFYLALLVGLLTLLLYNYHRSRPLDQERIEYCNELVSGMPERNEDEINQSINRFTDCLSDR